MKAKKPFYTNAPIHHHLHHSYHYSSHYDQYKKNIAPQTREHILATQKKKNIYTMENVLFDSLSLLSFLQIKFTSISDFHEKFKHKLRNQAFYQKFSHNQEP